MSSNAAKRADSKQFKSAVITMYGTESHILIARKEFVSSDVEPEGGKEKASKKPASTSKKRVESPGVDAGESSEVMVIRSKEKKKVENDEVR